MSKESESTSESKDCAILSIKSISKQFHNKYILSDISFDIADKDVFGIIGMSGSGKTTLFQMMTGFLGADSGDILVRSNVILPKNTNTPQYVSVFKNQNSVKKKFGFASQMPSFYEHLTVEENLFLYSSLHNIPAKKAKTSVDRLIKLVNLYDDKKTIASELSGGMQRRLDIACSLVNDPKVLILDEPTSDLDPVMRKHIWALVKSINDLGTTVIISSHMIEEIEFLCNKVAILNEQKLLGYGTLPDLRRILKKSLSEVFDALAKKSEK
jgi:ABC-2 type transport system ATP-binding protein